MRNMALAGALILAASLQSGQQKPSANAPQQNIQRYQLFPAKAPYETKTGEAFEEALFLIDTQTGEIWRYERSFSSVKDGKVLDQFPQSFSRVPVDGLQGWDRSAALHKFFEQLRKLGGIEQEK
jgi:hypothetical protein